MGLAFSSFCLIKAKNKRQKTEKPAGKRIETKESGKRKEASEVDKEASDVDKPSSEYTVRQGFSLIRKMDNEQNIRQFLKGDERKTMQEASERRINQLKNEKRMT